MPLRIVSSMRKPKDPIKCEGSNNFIKNCKNKPTIALVIVIHDDREEEGYCEEHKHQAEEEVQRFKKREYATAYIRELKPSK